MESEILVAEEVSQILRVKTQRIYELVRTNQIPFILIGQRQYRFSKQAIEKWLENGGSEKGGIDND